MRSKRIFPILIACSILLMFGATLWFLWTKSRPKPVVVETEHPARREIIHKVVASGTMEPRKEIEIKPRIAGILRRLIVQPGKLVKKGELIGEIQVIPDAVSLNDAVLRLRSATLGLERAKRELERVKKLGVSGGAALMEEDNLRSDYAIAEEELKAAENRVLLLRVGAAGKTKNASASTRVESTVDGMVLTVPVKEGSSVINANSFNPGTTIAVVADMSDMIFKGRVDEAEVSKLRVGMPVEIVIGALETKKIPGTLEHIAPKSQVKDGTTEFEIEVAVRIPDGLVVRAGYSANANIVLDRRENALSINESLLVFDKDKRFVEVQVAPDKFEKREVRLGLSDGIRVEVLSDLTEKDLLRKPRRAVVPGSRL